MSFILSRFLMFSLSCLRICFKKISLRFNIIYKLFFYKIFPSNISNVLQSYLKYHNIFSMTVINNNSNHNNLNQMKKGGKKPSSRLIVDEFQKIKKSQIQPTSKSSYSNEQNGPYMNFKVEEVACKFCGKYIPEQNIVYHNKICQSRLQDGENYYDMIYPRPQHHHKQKENHHERPISNEEKEDCNDDYYPFLRKEQVSQGIKNAINKPKRPMSALNKKIEVKPKSIIKPDEKEMKLKKVTSTSKMKDETKKYYPASREKGENKSSKYDQTYLKNSVVQKKQPLSLYPNSNSSKLKKKNVNMAQRFQNEERSIEERLKRPDSRSKKQERPQIKQKMKREQRQQDERRKNREQARLDQPQITTQKLKEIVRQKLKQDRQIDRQRKRQPVESNRREPSREPPQQQRQPIRTQVRNDRQTERQPRSNRNQNQNFRRQRNRPSNRNPRFIAPQTNTFLNLVSRTINNQLQMMNNQFTAMSNIFQNFSNFVNINIESHPNYYQFTTHELNSSSDQDSFDSDSSNSYSSSYDDYYEDQEEEREGMDEDQLKSIQNKRYRVEDYGQNQCTICLVELRNGDTIKQLFCDHVFHSECIEEWLRRKSACPVCRDQLGNG